MSSAVFIKGVVGPDPLLLNGLPQVAFIGRSNAGKSTLINTVTQSKDLARTSAFPGRTQQINLFLINEKFYLVDLPGYGFARASKDVKAKLGQLIEWYLFDSVYPKQKIVVIIDANVGPTNDDLDMIYALNQNQKNIIVVANKIDKVKKSALKTQLQKIDELLYPNRVFPCSSTNKIGIRDLTNEIFN